MLVVVKVVIVQMEMVVELRKMAMRDIADITVAMRDMAMIVEVVATMDMEMIVEVVATMDMEMIVEVVATMDMAMMVTSQMMNMAIKVGVVTLVV
jgi:hypothetical protein